MAAKKTISVAESVARVTVDVIARRVGEIGDASLSMSKIRNGWEVTWPTKDGSHRIEIVADDKGAVTTRMVDEEGRQLGVATFTWLVPEAVAAFVVESLR